MIRLLQLAALAFFLSSFGNAAPRPNILLIVSEDNGPELGCYGEPSVKTPNLDRLASQGVLFERAYVPQAGCDQDTKCGPLLMLGSGLGLLFAN